MKKLIIAVAIICSAVVAQAAAISWATVKMYNAEGLLVGSTVTFSVYLMDETTYNSLTVDNIWSQFGGKTADASGTTKALTSKTSISTTSDPYTTYYAALIATYGEGDSKKYYAEKTSVTTGEDGSTSYTFGSSTLSASEAAAGAWKSVPEPTSGLLLLVGMGALALRRKRA